MDDLEVLWPRLTSCSLSLCFLSLDALWLTSLLLQPPCLPNLLPCLSRLISIELLLSSEYFITATGKEASTLSLFTQLQLLCRASFIQMETSWLSLTTYLPKDIPTNTILLSFPLVRSSQETDFVPQDGLQKWCALLAGPSQKRSSWWFSVSSPQRLYHRVWVWVRVWWYKVPATKHGWASCYMLHGSKPRQVYIPVVLVLGCCNR